MSTYNETDNSHQVVVGIPHRRVYRKPACQINRDSSQYAGLQHFWSGCYPGGNYVYDLVGNNNFLFNTAGGDNEWVADGDRQGMVPSVPVSYYEAADSPYLQLTNNFTVSVWINTTATTGNILWKVNGSSFIFSSIGWAVFLSGGTAQFKMQDGTETMFAGSGTTVNDGKWHLITVTRNASLLLVYVDGILGSTSANSITFGTTANGQTLQLGGGTSNYIGLFDDVRVYNRALSSTEAANLYDRSTRYDLFSQPQYNVLGIMVQNQGLLGGGSATVSNTMANFDGSAGAASGGDPVINVEYNVTPLDGSLNNGSGSEQVTINEIMNNGAVGGGEGIGGYDLPIIDGSGGATVNGYYEYLQINNYTPDGGLLENGTADFSVIMTQSVSGGSLAGGSISPNQIYDQIGSGGIVDGSSLDSLDTIFAIYSIDLDLTGTAGLIGGGIVMPDGGADYFVDGGALVGGAADLEFLLFSETVSGGAVSGGDVLITHEVIIDGGALGGGDTDSTLSYTINSPEDQVGSGIVCGGDVEIYVIYTVTDLDGNATLNGVNTELSVIWFMDDPTGGAIAGGASEDTAETDNPVSGGLVVAGDSDFGITFPDESGGGFTHGGIAINTLYSIDIMSGGIVVGGPTDYFVLFLPDLSGGAVIGGDVVPIVTKTVSGSGGLVAGSAADWSIIYFPAPVGGAKVGGHGTLIFDDTMTGGGIVGGAFVTREHNITMAGGVLVGSHSDPVMDHIYVIVENCDGTLLCGYNHDDQFCAELEKVQGYSSKFLDPQRKDLTALCLQTGEKKPRCYGKTAYVPAITLCQQRLRLRTINLPPQRTITPPPEATSLSLVKKVTKKKKPNQTDAL